MLNYTCWIRLYRSRVFGEISCQPDIHREDAKKILLADSVHLMVMYDRAGGGDGGLDNNVSTFSSILKEIY